MYLPRGLRVAVQGAPLVDMHMVFRFPRDRGVRSRCGGRPPGHLPKRRIFVGRTLGCSKMRRIIPTSILRIDTLRRCSSSFASTTSGSEGSTEMRQIGRSAAPLKDASLWEGVQRSCTDRSSNPIRRCRGCHRFRIFSGYCENRPFWTYCENDPFWTYCEHR